MACTGCRISARAPTWRASCSGTVPRWRTTPRDSTARRRRPATRAARRSTPRETGRGPVARGKGERSKEGGGGGGGGGGAPPPPGAPHSRDMGAPPRGGAHTPAPAGARGGGGAGGARVGGGGGGG